MQADPVSSSHTDLGTFWEGEEHWVFNQKDLGSNPTSAVCQPCVSGVSHPSSLSLHSSVTGLGLWLSCDNVAWWWGAPAAHGVSETWVQLGP